MLSHSLRVRAAALGSITVGATPTPTPTTRSPHAPATTALHTTRLLRRPQTVKPNPFTSTSGKFDQSFEKMVGSLEQKLPFRQHHLAKGYLYDRNFGEETMDHLKDAAKQDIEGREPESPAARQARSYFTGADLSPEALGARSPGAKVAQQIQRQRYDRRILKESTEPAEYYYVQHSLQEKQRRTVMQWSAVAAVVVVLYMGWRRLAVYMREDYDPLTVDGTGNPQHLERY